MLLEDEVTLLDAPPCFLCCLSGGHGHPDIRVLRCYAKPSLALCSDGQGRTRPLHRCRRKCRLIQMVVLTVEGHLVAAQQPVDNPYRLAETVNAGSGSQRGETQRGYLPAEVVPRADAEIEPPPGDTV